MQFLVFLVMVIWLFVYIPEILAILTWGFVLFFLGTLAAHLAGLVR